VPRINLSEVAYEHLREGIVSYRYKPGTVLAEQEICELLNISRTPVREAFRRLEAEGMLNKIPKRGTFVQDLTYADILEICEIRMLFELKALENCVGDMPDEEIDTLEGALVSLQPDSPEIDYFIADSSLHKSIMKYCLNSRMNAYLDNLNSQLERLRRIGGSMPNRLPKSRQEHLDIICAIRSRNLEKAIVVLKYHLGKVRENTLESYQKNRYGI
jgi:DNA-binding GntR family transcriptional regulator